jgi:hypothetical protein
MKQIARTDSVEKAVLHMLAISSYINDALHWSNLARFVSENLREDFSQEVIEEALSFMCDSAGYEFEDVEEMQEEIDFMYALFRAVSVTKIENPDLRKFL